MIEPAVLLIVAFVLLSAALLAGVAWLAFSGSAERSQTPGVRKAARGCLAVGLAGGLATIAVLAVLSAPYRHPERYLGEVERNAAPLVAALDRFSAETGQPPQRLSELAPVYISALPDSGFPGDRNYHYSAIRSANGAWNWSLSVSCDFVARPKPACALSFTSSERVWRVVRAE